MWRRACALVLLCSLVYGEDPGPTTAASTNSAPTTSPGLDVHPYYSGLRRGTGEEIAIILRLPRGFVTVSTFPVAGITPLTLDLQPTKDLTVTQIVYPKPFKRTISPYPGQISAMYFPFRLKLRASRTAPLGLTIVNGKLTFQLVDGKAVYPPQEVKVQIALRIVDHHAPVLRDRNWPFTHTPVAEVVLMIVLSPILLPFALACAVFMDGCG